MQPEKIYHLPHTSLPPSRLRLTKTQARRCENISIYRQASYKHENKRTQGASVLRKELPYRRLHLVGSFSHSSFYQVMP